MDGVEKLARQILKSSRVVFFGGAGVSTESGIPDFRSAGGVYDMLPEEALSYPYFKAEPESFLEIYRTKLLFKEAKPNEAHLFLARLERAGRLSAVVTQNVDGLHQRAGSKAVFELHGTAERCRCDACGERFDGALINEYSSPREVARCGCGGILRPDIVMYGEGLDGAVVSAAVGAISKADMLIIGGTSLNVYPAASYVDFFGGGCLALVNKTPLPAARSADIDITGSIGEVFKAAGDIIFQK